MECNQAIIFNKDSWRQILSFSFHVFAICSFMPRQKFQESDVLHKLSVWRSLWDQPLMNINGSEEIVSGRDNSRTGWSMYTTNSTLPVNCSYRNNLSGHTVLWFLRVTKCTYKMLEDMPWKSVVYVLSRQKKRWWRIDVRSVSAVNCHLQRSSINHPNNTKSEWNLKILELRFSLCSA